MPQFVIERNLPGAAKLSDGEIQKISAKSNSVLHDMKAEGTAIKWDHSYVAGDKIYCVYDAPSEQAVRDHAKRGGFPADKVTPVARVISPASAGKK
jgi:hypothetical protein